MAIRFMKLTEAERVTEAPKFTIWTIIELNTAMICANLPGVSAAVQSQLKESKLWSRLSHYHHTNSQKKLSSPTHSGSDPKSTLTEKMPTKLQPSILDKQEYSVEVEVA
jgi:hypothetical protein